jgi:hypothetical protein
MSNLEVYVLGAGASYVHGAPLTDGILPYSLTRLQEEEGGRLEMVRAFLTESFHFPANAPADDPVWKRCPGLVDVLSVVDMAIDRKESLSRRFDHAHLRDLREALEYAIFRALAHSLSRDSATGRRSRATQKLVKTFDPTRHVTISFNYDILIDWALAKHSDELIVDPEALETMERIPINYGVNFTNLDLPVEDVPRFKLLKLHGSFNWLMSPFTGNLYFGGLRKAVGLVFDETSSRVQDLQTFYRKHGSFEGSREPVKDLQPVLITPTHLKDLRNVHLAQLWRQAEETLRRAGKITFVGYSFPGDDLHIKYLFKRAIETRSGGADPPKITVVEKQPENSEVERNYRRFFGDELKFFRHGFDEYVEHELEA